MARRAGVTGRIRHAGGNITAGQGTGFCCRDGDAPAAVRLYQCGVAVAVNGHGHRLAGRRGGGPGNDQVRLRFAGVKDIVRGDSADGDHRRGGVDAVIVGRRRAVTGGIAHTHLHAGAAVGDPRQVRRRYGQGPLAVVIHRGGVRSAVKHHRHCLTSFHVRGRAGQYQVRALLGGVNHVVGGHAADGDGRCRGIHGHIVGGGAAVACRVRHGHGDGGGAVVQGADVRCRHTDAPVARRVHHGGVIFAVHGHGDRITRRRAAGGAADELGLAVLGIVDDVVGGHGADGHHR